MNTRIRFPCCARMPRSSGEVAEWSIVPDSKSGVLQGTEGSNPSLSAIFLFSMQTLEIPTSSPRLRTVEYSSIGWRCTLVP